MDNTNVLPRLVEVINKSSSGTIALPINPSPDATASACALYLALHKMGKSVTLACSSKVNYSLTACEKIQNQLATGGDNLVVSFPYTEGSIDKVDYNIQGQNFNLIITPRPGFPKLDPKQVKYSYTGGRIDFIIVIDAPVLNSLGNLYTDNEKQFQGREIINIDRHLTNSYYGTVNYINKTSSSLSEMALKLIQSLGVQIDKDIATNLYAGIATATNNFSSYSVTADTFENIAHLLRLGAVKKIIKKPDQFSPTPLTKPFSPTPLPPSPSLGSAFYPPMQNQKPIENVEKEPTPQDAQTPQDWLKPKIFRGGGGLI